MRRIPATDPAAYVEAMHALDGGGLIAFPAALGYVLGADALDDASLERCLEVRGLPPDRALPVLVHDLEAARHVARVTTAARVALARGLQEGALLVLPAAPTAPDALRGGGDTVAVGVAPPGFARDFTARFGPVVATAARRGTGPRPTELAVVAAAFGGAVAVGIDDGPRQGRRGVLVDATGPEARVLREGEVPPVR